MQRSAILPTLIFLPVSLWWRECVAENQAGSPAPAMEEVSVVGRQISRAAGGSHRSLELVDPEDALGSPPNSAQILQQLPGVGYSGQGGLFQTVSIRGLSQHRVANFYLDVPILTERRAGTTSQFIDPLMLGAIAVLRGPASTYYGSGAMGGVLQFQPRRVTGLEARLGWSSGDDGDVRYLAGGTDDLSVAISHRRAADETQSSDGTALFTGFEQSNAQFGARSRKDELAFAFDTLLSHGTDIGKSSSRYPDERITQYPRSRHWLGQLSLDAASNFHSSLFFHYQDLITRVENSSGSSVEGDSQSLDLGGNAMIDLGFGTLRSRLGLDYLARRNVHAREFPRGHTRQPAPDQDNLDAEQDQVGLFADATAEYGAWSLGGGLRGSWVTQQAARSDRDTDSALSGFARADWQLAAHTAVHLELASGVRFPTLSERYFSGTTGRGVIQGNPDLDPESSLSLEAGLASSWQRTRLELRAYTMTVDNIITRVEPAPDEFSYVNRGDGDINGIEVGAHYQASDGLLLFATGQYLDGEDDNGVPLPDIAPNTLAAGLRYAAESWKLEFQYQHRLPKDNVPANERTIDRAHLVSAEFSVAAGSAVEVSLWGHNLLNDAYWMSTDRLSTQGEGRSIGVSVSWRR